MSARSAEMLPAPPAGNLSARRESALQRRISLGDVLDLPSFNEVVKSFVQLYRVGIKVFDDRGAKLADLKVGNGDFCGYVFSFAEGRGRCTATVARVKDGPLAPVHGACAPSVAEPGELKGMVAVPCFTGLRYLILPLIWEGDPFGRVIFGPFTPEALQDLPPSLKEISSGLDLSQAKLHLAKIQRAPESSVAQVLLHFAQLLETLIAAGQKTYFTSQLHIEATLETNRELEAKNQRLEQLNSRLKELDRLKSSFLATVSHELRTPLTSIIGYSEMLGEGMCGSLNPEQLEYIRTITDKGESLLKLITSILDLSQIEAGKVRLNFELLDASEVVRQAVSSLKPQSQKKGVALEMRVPEARVRVSADRDKLRQVVVNLLANAVKFTPQGGRVSVALSEVSEAAYNVTVEDTGRGIPQDQIGRIFESFYQVDSSSTREFGGAGLGLAIVKSYVEGHGGRVQVHSDLGKGARFTLSLPVQPPQHGTIQIEPPVTTPNRF